MSTLYLEHYLDSLESLPSELRRNFTLMHELDKKNKDILTEVDAASDEYLRKVTQINEKLIAFQVLELSPSSSQVRELEPDQRKSEMTKIQDMFAKAKAHGDDKVSIAIQTYELVDKHIRWVMDLFLLC